MKHYKYGGSTAGRTVQCPSWAELAATMPPQAESSYAAEGVALHTCMEMLLEGSIDSPEDLAGKDIRGLVIEDDHVDRLNMALEAWDELCLTSDIIDYELEQTFELTQDVGGTADVIAWSATRVFVVDWKFGQGVEVDAEESAQGMFYSICAQHERAELFKDKEILVVIIQPIPSRDVETLKVWSVDAPTFKKFRTDLFAAIAYDGEPEYRMGKYCKFCPAETICPQKTGAAAKALLVDDDIAAQLAENLDMALQLTDWVKAVVTLAHEQAELGTTLKGFKLVAKRATRKWSDPVEAEKKLRKMVRSSRGDTNLKVSEVLAPAKLLSPPQIEKVFKKKKLDFGKVGDYIVTDSTGTTLVREDDKRPAIPSAAALKQALGRTT